MNEWMNEWMNDEWIGSKHTLEVFGLTYQNYAVLDRGYI